MSTTTVTYTANAPGNIRASTTLVQSGTASYDVDYSAVFEGQVHVLNTPGASVSTTSGVRVDVYRKYGNAPTTGQSPILSYTVASVASTPASADVFLTTGKYTVKITNLDAGSAVTVEITGDTVTNLSTT